MDAECSTCHSIQQAIASLQTICKHIDFTCSDKKKKKDFGLEKSYILAQIKAIKKMQEWHDYYHATGKSLSGGGSDIQSSSGNTFRRFRFG